MQAFLELVAAGRVDPAPLTTHRFPVEQAGRAYAALTSGDGERRVRIVLEYAYEEGHSRPLSVSHAPREGTSRIGLIGAGSFARGTILPALQAEGAEARGRGSGGRAVRGRRARQVR